MNRLTLLASTFLFSASAFAVPEANFAQVSRELLDNVNKTYVFGKFPGTEKATLGYVKYGSEPGPKGCLVISPGQGEPAIKYVEVMHDLAEKGYSPIYAIDHRGQGFSTRLLPDSQKSHVEKFSDYVNDFTSFVNNVVLANTSCQGHSMNLIAHSMGGAIAAKYLESVGDNSPFQKAVLSAPMLRIAFPNGKTEDSVIRETWFACNTPFGPKCTDFAPGKGPYDASLPFEGNPTTHSAVRFELKRDIFSKWKESQVGGPTVQWVRESAMADKELRAQPNVSRILTPLLILQATDDKIVDNSGQDEFCALAKSCHIEKIQGANHEILMESDSIRDPAIATLLSFLSQ